MRLLIVDDAMGLWGAQRFLVRLAPLLAERGIDQVLAAPPGSATAEAWTDLGLEHLPLQLPSERTIRQGADPGAPFSVTGVARQLMVSARTVKDLVRAVEVTGADLVQANAHWTHLDAAVAGRLRGFPTLLLLHEEQQSGVATHLRSVATRLATASVAVSKAVADSLDVFVKTRVTVVRNGVDVQEFRPADPNLSIRAQLAEDPARPVVLVMSRLDRSKNIDQVVEAVARTPPELGVQLAVAGAASLDWSWPRDLRELAERRLGRRARFLGERRDPQAVLRAADVLALASDVEGLPLSVLEAQASGTPVVAVPTAGIPEVVDHGRTGLIVPRGAVDAMAHALTTVVTDTALAARLGRQARESVVRLHTLQMQADKLAQVVLETAGRTSHSRGGTS